MHKNTVIKLLLTYLVLNDVLTTGLETQTGDPAANMLPGGL